MEAKIKADRIIGKYGKDTRTTVGNISDKIAHM